MNLIDILIVASSVIVLLLLWVLIGASSLKMRFQSLQNAWEMLDESLRKRQSVVPLLIETFRKYEGGQSELVQTLIDSRIRAAKEYKPGAKKIEFESDLSQNINMLFDVAKQNPAFSKDTAFLAIKHEIELLESHMEDQSAKYNENVRIYNKRVSSFALFLVAKLFGYKPTTIFDVES